MNFGRKNKEKSSSNMNVYSGDIHSVTVASRDLGVSLLNVNESY